MSEILVGMLMGIDVLTIYIFLPYVRSRFFLSLWTGFLHMLFPFIGYMIGGFIFNYFSYFASYLSVVLLFCVGLQFLLENENNQNFKINPLILAVSLSLDTFSVSVSFGMLNLQKQLFILSAGISAFFLSYMALTLAKNLRRLNRNYINRFVGLLLIGLSIWTYVTLK